MATNYRIKNGDDLSADAEDTYGSSSNKLTLSTYLICFVAATGGLSLGYSSGISGGLSTMTSFLKKFFPSVYEEMEESSTSSDGYCQFDSEVLTAFTSSLYLAGLVSSIVAGQVTRLYGRRFSMILGGSLFFVGSLIGTTALNVPMLILGRILLGFGYGFTNQATPVYLSEMAPPKWRGVLSTFFPVSTISGAALGNLVNYLTSQIDGSIGWRLSFGLGGVPALIMTVGALFVPESVSSLIERGMIDDARRSLKRVRDSINHNSDGTDQNIDNELERLIEDYNRSSRLSSATTKPWTRLMKRQYRPQVVMALAISVFQQFTGTTLIWFYAPVLFISIGFDSNSALLASTGIAGFSILCCFVSFFVIDRFGRKVLFIEGGIQMFLFQGGVACLLVATYGATLSEGASVLMVLFLIMYTAGYAWSWAPLQSLVTSEIFPLEVRSVGVSIAVAVNFGLTFLLAQFLVAMLCNMKYMIFVFFMTWNIFIVVFIAAFLPETKGLALEDMHVVWEKHWFWRRYTVQVNYNDDQTDQSLIRVPLTNSA